MEQVNFIQLARTEKPLTQLLNLLVGFPANDCWWTIPLHEPGFWERKI